MLSICFSGSVYAETNDYVEKDSTYEAMDVTPAWTYILDVWQVFDISSSGRAEIATLMDTKNGDTDSLKIVSNLQQLQNGSWTTIKSWTRTTEATLLTLEATWYVYKGYSYRLVTSYYAYSQGDVESVSLTSRTVDY